MPHVSVIANFKQVVKDGSLKLHPLVTRLVDEETLKKMGVDSGLKCNIWI